MQVQVPSERLMAQWNLGAWHLTRHCEKNPNNSRMWFNDYPYGILGAETYMILRTLDLMGSHKAAEDGFDQWVSLPMDPKSGEGHHPWALPDRPNGLFLEGHGCLTHAVGPPGVGERAAKDRQRYGISRESVETLGRISSASLATGKGRLRRNHFARRSRALLSLGGRPAGRPEKSSTLNLLLSPLRWPPGRASAFAPPECASGAG